MNSEFFLHAPITNYQSYIMQCILIYLFVKHQLMPQYKIYVHAHVRV